jgi:D-serine deaminase-like pyridoxal phosphate-dependent protein
MATDAVISPFASDVTFRVAEAARVLTPALLVNRDRVQHNIASTLRLLGDDRNRWRPHVKTAKLSYVMRMLVEAGVHQFKCATGLELSVACQAGARDVLVAYPLTGANAGRLRDIAEHHQSIAISVLVDHESQLAEWRGSSLSVFVDVNPGMNRTGVREDQAERILHLSQSVASSGLEFRGLHYYDGHLSKCAIAERCRQAHLGYERLMRIVQMFATVGIEVPEVITAGTPAFPCSVSFSPFSKAPFIHRVSPGTVIYCDTTSLAQLPAEYEYLPATVVMTRVVSHPAPGIVTCDAGHKTVSADAGVPTCVVLGHPELEPLAPSEEHLPMRVADGAVVPAIGELLYLVPRHVCPTVNNFDDAVIVSDRKLIAVEPVSSRGRERPIQI